MIDVTVFLEPRYHPQVGVFHRPSSCRLLVVAAMITPLSSACLRKRLRPWLMLSRGQAPFASWKGRQMLSFACGRR